MWKEKDESMNPAQTYYKDMIYTDKYAEAERELRIGIDNLMRQELELLQAALERDRTQKGKKQVERGNQRGINEITNFHYVHYITLLPLISSFFSLCYIYL